MGGRLSAVDLDEKARSDAIDRQIEVDHRKDKRRIFSFSVRYPSNLHLTSSRPRRPRKNDDNQTDEDRPSRRLHRRRTRPISTRRIQGRPRLCPSYLRKVGMECVEYNICADKILDYRLDGSPGTSMSNPDFSQISPKRYIGCGRTPSFPKSWIST